jgi:hypothetical protein
MSSWFTGTRLSPRHVEKQIPEPKGNNPVGVDIGMLATSNGFKAKGEVD